jgi:glyoxylase I family protein
VAGEVRGIGGFFFRAKDPDGLARWYRDHFGVTLPPTQEGAEPWRQEAGPTVFAPFPAASTHFGDPGRQWMINFRVRNLDALVGALRAAGVQVTVGPEPYPHGRFARLTDPEGNPIELWEPPVEAGPP